VVVNTFATILINIYILISIFQNNVLQFVLGILIIIVAWASSIL